MTLRSSRCLHSFLSVGGCDWGGVVVCGGEADERQRGIIKFYIPETSAFGQQFY